MDFDHPPADPVQELHRWLERAQREAGVPNPNAMTLATVDAAGQPSTRIVLLKHLDERGAVFFTNRSSRKGRELAVNPRVSLLLHWDRLEQQVRIEGVASPVGDEESDAYFASRPRGSRIGAWASEQSAPAPDRAAIEALAREIEQRFAGVEIPRPPHWGGYRVSLESIELWQGRADRLHDRVVYAATVNGWQARRLWP